MASMHANIFVHDQMLPHHSSCFLPPPPSPTHTAPASLMPDGSQTQAQHTRHTNARPPTRTSNANNDKDKGCEWSRRGCEGTPGAIVSDCALIFFFSPPFLTF